MPWQRGPRHTARVQSEYKLARQTQGAGYFARVIVEATIAPEGIDVSDEVAEDIDWRSPDVGRRGHGDWVEAATEGARCCLAALVEGRKILGGRVVVQRVMGHDCHTTPNCVWCASALATWQALCPLEPLPAFELTEGQWRILWLTPTVADVR